MGFTFKKAQRAAAKARICILGPSGAGKTFTSLEVARGLVGPQGRIAVIDSESKSASLYAGALTDFDVLELSRTDAERDADRRAHRGGLFLEYDFDPRRYIQAIEAADAAGYDAIVVDSLSHAWDGVKAIVDEASRRNKGGNSWGAWAEATPIHKELIDAMLRARAHVVVTMRVKTEWVIEKDERTGKTKPVKIGLQPEQRAGMEYEFGLVGELDLEHTFAVSKTRYMGLGLDQALIKCPGRELGARIALWLAGGEQPAATPAAPPVDDALAKARGYITRAVADEDARAFLLEQADQVEAGQMTVDELRALVKDVLAQTSASQSSETPAVEDAQEARDYADALAEAQLQAAASTEQPAKSTADTVAACRSWKGRLGMRRTVGLVYDDLVDQLEQAEGEAAETIADAIRELARTAKRWDDSRWSPADLLMSDALLAVADRIQPYRQLLMLAEYFFAPDEVDGLLRAFEWALSETTEIEIREHVEWVCSLVKDDQRSALRMTPAASLEARRAAA